MKKKHHSTQIILILLLSFSTHLYAQTDGENTVLWEISGNELEQTSYLFGTIHIMPKSEFEAFKTADKILENCDQIVFEMSMDVPLKQKIEWAREFLLPAGQTIKDFMSEEEFIRLSSYSMDSLKIKESRFNTYIKFKPLAFYSALIPHVIGKRIEGYEVHFAKIAKKKKIPVAELESFEIQMAIFDSIPNNIQMEMFFSGDLNLHKEMAELLEIYKSQNIYEMASLIDEDDSEYEAYENELLIQRNKNWVVKLDNLMREKSSFIAVGAGHLAGESGLILLLREMGYTVEGICLIPECENQSEIQN